MDPGKLYNTQLAILKFDGIQLTYQNNLSGFLTKVHGIFTFFMLNFVSIFFYYNITIGNPTVEVFSEMFSVSLAAIEGTIKMIVYFRWSYKFQKLLDVMTQLLNSGQSMSEKRFNEVSKIANVLLKVYLTSAIFTTSGYFFGSLYRNIFLSQRVHMFKGRWIGYCFLEILQTLNEIWLNFSFFVDLHQSPVFEISFVFISYIAYFIGRVYVVTDTLFFNIGFFISEHMKVIQNDLMKLEPKNFHSNLKSIMKKHQEILKFCHLFNDVFRPIIVQKFTSIASVICIIGFQLITVRLSAWNAILILPLNFQTDDVNLIINNIFFLLSVVTGVFIYCVVGNRIMVEVRNFIEKSEAANRKLNFRILKYRMQLTIVAGLMSMRSSNGISF